MFKILRACGMLEQIVGATEVLYKDTTAYVVTPDEETELFDATADVYYNNGLRHEKKNKVLYITSERKSRRFLNE